MSTSLFSTECEVCYEEMVEPRSLPCGHTFCRQCLQELVNSANNLMCPIDLNVFPVPAGNADKLMRNYYLENELENLRKKPKKAAAAKFTRAKHKGRQDEFFCESSVQSDCSSCVSKHKEHDFCDYSESWYQCALRIEQLQVDVKKFKLAVDNEKIAKTGAVEAQVAACKRKVDAAVSKIREIVQVLNATADGLQNKAAQCRQLIQAASASKLATLDGLQREVVALSNAAFSINDTDYSDCTLESRLKQVHELTQKMEEQRAKLTSEKIPDVSSWFSDSQLTRSLATILDYATKLKQNLTKDTHDNSSLQQLQAALNEKPLQQKQILVLAGRWNSNDVMAYDTSSDTWATVASMSFQRWSTAATLWQGKVVVAGGCSTNKCLSTVEQFDPESNSWTALPDMLHKRQWLALACLDNTLYAIGGKDRDSTLASVERYESNAEQWQLAAPLNVKRDKLCCAVLGVKLLAVGGSDGSNELATCELLDGAKQKWQFTASLKTTRCNASASTVDEKVYVFGGVDKNWKFLDSVEEYADGKWTLLPVRLSVARMKLAAATVNGRVYVCGGDPEGIVVECFDANKRQISRVAQLPKDFDGSAAASVALSNQAWSRLFGLTRH